MHCIYIVLFQSFQPLKALIQHKSAFTHSHTQSHTKGRWLLDRKPTCSLGTHTHTHIHTAMVQPSGTIWGSVSCPRTLRHVDGGTWDWTTDPLIGRRPALPIEQQPPKLKFTYSVINVRCECPLLAVNQLLQKNFPIGWSADSWRVWWSPLSLTKPRTLHPSKNINISRSGRLWQEETRPETLTLLFFPHPNTHRLGNSTHTCADQQTHTHTHAAIN